MFDLQRSLNQKNVMCFSASASFGAGVILTAAGVITRKKITSPEQEPFAAIPFLFAAQQFVEGFLWLSFNNPMAPWHLPATYLFLIFAQVVWPFWVPFAMLKLEQNPKRRKILLGLVGLGAMISIYLALCLIIYPVNSEVVGYHIGYTLSFPLAFTALSGVIYFIPTVLSPYVSSIKRMPILGMAIFCSYLFTKLYYKEHVISIWCFLAAILSTLVYFVLSARQKEVVSKKLFT
jgi:hypothetical protein